MKLLFNRVGTRAALPALLGMLLLKPLVAAEAPARVTNAVKETDLATVTLTPQAEQRLGVKTVAIESRAVAVTRLYGGEVVMPLGAPGLNVAPVMAGSLDDTLKLADAQADADGRVRQAQVQLDTARIAVERAQKMLKAEAGSVRAVDEVKVQEKLAEAALTTARERRALLGQPINAAAPASRLWVRVPVYSGERRELDPKASATISPLSAPNNSASITAKPVTGPPTANAAAGTVDLFYELEGAAHDLRAGERVAVTLRTPENAQNLVVPFAAVMHDIHGGQWVYEKTAPQTFVRRRVQVARVMGKDAVLANGLPVGAKIVTDGAAEIFGTEFGAGK